MNTAQQSYTPATVWHGGLPHCFIPLRPAVAKMQPRRASKVLVCAHCGALFAKRVHESHSDFEARRYCGYECNYAHKSDIKQARMKQIAALLPATKKQLVSASGLTFAELERTLRALVRGRIADSISHPPGESIYVLRKCKK